jgi:hypothetical protein
MIRRVYGLVAASSHIIRFSKIGPENESRVINIIESKIRNLEAAR